MHAAGELPGLLIEPMRQVPETRVVHYLSQVYHREVDTSLGDESHGPDRKPWLKGVMEMESVQMADPPRFEHGFPAPEARVISRLHYGS